MHHIDTPGTTIATVQLECYRGQTWPVVQFVQPCISKEHHEISTLIRHETYYIDISSSCIEMIFPQKIREETVVDQSGKILRDQQISIKSIFVDSILLDMHLVRDRSEFMPGYREDFIEYCKQNSLYVDHGPCNTLDLFHAGTWRLNWIGPFWSWYQDQRRQRQKLHHDISKFQNMIGDDHDKIDQDLQKFRRHYFT